jgi:hypothetical protein
METMASELQELDTVTAELKTLYEGYGRDRSSLWATVRDWMTAVRKGFRTGWQQILHNSRAE